MLPLLAVLHLFDVALMNMAGITYKQMSTNLRSGKVILKFHGFGQAAEISSCGEQYERGINLLRSTLRLADDTMDFIAVVIFSQD